MRKRSTQGSNDRDASTTAGESGHQTKKMKIELKQEVTNEETEPSTSREQHPSQPGAATGATGATEPKRKMEEEKRRRVEPKTEPGTSANESSVRNLAREEREQNARTPSPQPGPSTVVAANSADQQGRCVEAPMADDLHLDCLSSDTEPEDEDEDVTVVTIAR